MKERRVGLLSRDERKEGLYTQLRVRILMKEKILFLAGVMVLMEKKRKVYSLLIQKQTLRKVGIFEN